MSTAWSQKIRTTQRKMLRAIISEARRSKIASEDSSKAMSEEFDDDEELENWVQWIRRVTHEAPESMKKVDKNDWVNEQRRRVWRWAGHVARRTDGRLTSKVVMWTPSGQCIKGRPQRRWEDALVSFAVAQLGEAAWHHVAKDRNRWRAFETLFAEA